MTLCLGRGHSIRSTSIFCANIRFLRSLNLPATLMERIPVKVFDEFAAEGTRMSARSDLWRHAASVAASPGWARAMAAATRDGNSSRQHQSRGGAQGGGARVRPIARSFLARLPSHAGRGAAQVANSAAPAGIQGK